MRPKHVEPAHAKDILLAEDLAEIFRISVSQARQNLSAGVYGPRFKVGKRYGVLRSLLLRHLEDLSVLPVDPTDPSPSGIKTIKLVSRAQRTLKSESTQRRPR